MPTRKEIETHYRKYDRRATEAMRELRREGRDIATPVRNPSEASTDRLRVRARFGQRKALEVINRKQPLKDNRGFPTPAAMQFRRWGYRLPTTVADVRQILKQSRNFLRKTSEE